MEVNDGPVGLGAAHCGGILPSLGKDDATAFLQRALAWFGQLGVAVERVMTDNGSAYRSSLFANELNHDGVRHIRTRPFTPRTNGKAERFIQTSLREWAYARPYRSSAERVHAIGPRTDALQPRQISLRHRRSHPCEQLFGNDS